MTAFLPSAIRTDGGTQPRAQIDMFIVDDYADAMRAGATFPPVDVFFDGTDYWLADGFHRHAAAVQAGVAEIAITVHQGTRRDAILFSCGANAAHGLRRTNADKRRAVATLLRDEEWGKWTDSEIARRCAVSQPFVSGLSASLRTVISEARTYTTKHGTMATMNTANIGTREPKAPPSPSLRLLPEVREVIRETPLVDSREDVEALASKPKETQKEIVGRIAAGQAESVREALSQINREKRIDRILVQAEPLDSLARRFPVLYADPPWQYEHQATETRAVENHYPTMRLSDIQALPVPEIATEDCVLFLWATSPKLAEALSVVDAWGFTYRTCMVWVKDHIGQGHWARQRHELLLIAAKGDFPSPPDSVLPDSVLVAPRREHSAKPPEFYGIIERMYPELPKLELFARSEREGWCAWGNEVGDASRD